MSRSIDGQFVAQLDAYLDGLMTREQRDRFDEQMTKNDHLRNEVDRQHSVDKVLRRAFAPPHEESLRRIAELACDHGIDPIPLRRAGVPILRMFAAAAAIVMLIAGSWMIWLILGPQPAITDPYAPQAWRSMQQVYEDERADGFLPDWVCRDDLEFQETFRSQLGQRMLLNSLPEGVAAIGLSYSNTISPWTICLLSEAADEEIIVFIDRLDQDSDTKLVAQSGLYLHRKVIGELVLYELSPLDSPRVIQHFHDPDAEGRD